MRQIFQNLPWVQPAVPPVIASLYERRGVLQKVKRNQVLKAGGDNPKSSRPGTLCLPDSERYQGIKLDSLPHPARKKHVRYLSRGG